MSGLTFNDILERSVDDIHEPVALPMGHWRLKVISGKLKRSKADNGPVAKYLFTAVPVEPMDDVSEVELEDFDMEGVMVYHEIPIWDKASEWNVMRFLNTLGYEFEQGDKLAESAAKAKNYEFTANAKHRVNPNDEDKPFVDLDDIQAVE